MLLAAAAAIFVAAFSREPEPDLIEGHAFPIPSDGETLVVEVLNASGRTGLARQATRMLRRAGVDVVYLGNAPYDTLTASVILARDGDTVQSARVAELLGVSGTRVAPDSVRRVDVTVLLGRDFAPTGEYHP